MPAFTFEKALLGNVDKGLSAACTSRGGHYASPMWEPEHCAYYLGSKLYLSPAAGFA